MKIAFLYEHFLATLLFTVNLSTSITKFTIAKHIIYISYHNIGILYHRTKMFLANYVNFKNEPLG